MTPGAVAKQAVNAIFSGKTGTITGFINQPGSFLTWLLPKKPVEKTAAGIYGTGLIRPKFMIGFANSFFDIIFAALNRKWLRSSTE